MSILHPPYSNGFVAEARMYANAREPRLRSGCAMLWGRSSPGSQEEPGSNGVTSPSPNSSRSPQSSVHPRQGQPPRSLSLRSIAATTTTVRSATKAITAIVERDAIYLDDWSETVAASKDAAVSFVIFIDNEKVRGAQTTISPLLLRRTARQQGPLCGH